MARYRNNLPQLAGDLFLTDGGIETTLIFREGLELPYFAAFDLLKRGRDFSPQGLQKMRAFYLGWGICPTPSSKSGARKRQIQSA